MKLKLMLTQYHLTWSSQLPASLMISPGTRGIILMRGDIEEQDEEEH